MLSGASVAPASSCVPGCPEPVRAEPRAVGGGGRLLGTEAARGRQRGGTRLLAGGSRVLLAELVDATGGVHDLLLARIERMAVRAHLDLQIVPQRRARLEA